MAQVRTQVEQVLRQIDRMTEEQQCELLEAMLLKQRRRIWDGARSSASGRRFREEASSR